MFEENQFKTEIIGGLPSGSTITLYRSGDMVDLCRGPHLPNTGYLRTAMVGNMNRAFWRGDAKNAPLQVAPGCFTQLYPTHEALAVLRFQALALTKMCPGFPLLDSVQWHKAL